METVLILFILTYMGGDPAMKEKLRDFLSFYRENRDLFAAFMQNGATVSESVLKKSTETNSRPQNEAGNSAILEEYLKRL